MRLFLASISRLASPPVAEAMTAVPVDLRMTNFRLDDVVDEEESGASMRRRPQVGRVTAVGCFCSTGEGKTIVLVSPQ